MPADDVRRQLQGQSPTIALASRLTQRYATTLTATALRVIELTRHPAAVVVLRGDNTVKWFWRNDAMKQTGFWQPRGTVKPNELFSYSAEEQAVDPALWLDESRATQWEICQSYAPMPSYDQTLFVLRAESREGEKDFLEISRMP